MKKGITFMALVIMIAIILTLTTTAVVSGVNALNNSKKIKFATEISFVQEVINSYVNVENNIDFTKTYSIDLSSASQDVKEQFNTEVLIEGKKIVLYYLDIQNLDIFNNLEFTYGKNSAEDDIYLYSLDTGKVYYKKGLELNGKIYYTLNDELTEKIDYDLLDNEFNNSIIFVKNTDDWINTFVKCELKISKAYGNISLYNSNENITMNPTKETTTYNIYNFEINKNGSLKIQCTNSNNETITKIYDITNIDTTPPHLEISDVTSLIDADTKEINKSVQILRKYDDESGIKVIKYEKTKIASEDVKSYFLSNGIALNNDSITIPNDIQNVTIYIEDNAGNYNYVYVQI